MRSFETLRNQPVSVVRDGIKLGGHHAKFDIALALREEECCYRFCNTLETQTL